MNLTTCKSYAEARRTIASGDGEIELDYIGAYLDLPLLQTIAPNVAFKLTSPAPVALWWAPTDTSSRQLVDALTTVGAVEPGAIVILAARDPATYGVVPGPRPDHISIYGDGVVAAWGPRAHASAPQWPEARPLRDFNLAPSKKHKKNEAVGLGPLHIVQSVEEALERLPHLRHRLLYLDFADAAQAASGLLASAWPEHGVTLVTQGTNGHWYGTHVDGSSFLVAAP